MAPIKSHFAEFSSSQSSDKAACEFTKEHWRLLIGHNALGVLTH